MEKTHEFPKRLLIAVLVLLVFQIFRNIPVTGVDLTAYEEELNTQKLMTSMISSGRNSYSVMALGLRPFMLMSIGVMFVMAFFSSEHRSRISQIKITRITDIGTLLIAVIMAVSKVRSFHFYSDSIIIRIIDAAELTAGAAVMLVLINLSQKRGLGGILPIMIVNMTENLIGTLSGHSFHELYPALVLCLVGSVLGVFMENKLINIPVQRVSIHNTYADKSFISFKLNPVGFMPVMYSTMVFSAPTLLASGVLMIWPQNRVSSWIMEHIQLTDIIGIAFYLFIVLAMTVALAFIMLSPGELAEHLQKGGDSIIGVYAGRPTVRYLRKTVFLLSLFGGSVMAAVMGISLYIAWCGYFSPDIAMLPATAMMLTGFICSLIQEIMSYIRLDSYHFFM